MTKSIKTDQINWTDISDIWNTRVGNKDYTSVDLFSGAGGMAKGFEMAGFTPICGLDFLKEACMTYRHNFSHPVIEGDITKKETKSLFVDEVNKKLRGRTLTVLSGGFPCQGFSMSGNRLVEDSRNSLYKDMLEIISKLQPEFIVAENVKGLRSMLDGKVEDKIKEDIEKLGYSVTVTVLNSANYYVPQKRERVIFIANRIGASNLHPAPLMFPDQYITTEQAIGDLISIPDTPEFNHVRTRHSENMKRRLALVPEGQGLYEKYSDSWKKCPWNQASCTIKENHGGVNIHPIDPRVITAREMARLQSFPDDFIFKGSKGKQMVQIGNAVPPLLAKAIAMAIHKAKTNAGATNPPEIYLASTLHAYERARERMGWSRKTLDKMMPKAFEEGIQHKDTKGTLKKYITKIWFNHKNINNIRIYGENIFFFLDYKLITIYRLDNNLIKHLQYCKNKNKK